MKIFISWSGKLSNAIAQIVKKYLPCIIQNATVFCSSEDIEKGENWDGRLTSELAESCFGIICLTPSNKDAAWINFEAGAIAKTLDSRLTALLINLKPSDIQGPLKRYQATNIDERDIRKLVTDINKSSGNTITDEVLSISFDAIWPKVKQEISEAVNTYSKGEDSRRNDSKTGMDSAIEEILQLTRKQSVEINTLGIQLQKIDLSPQQMNGFKIDKFLEMVEFARAMLRQTINKARMKEDLALILKETDIETAYAFLCDSINEFRRDSERFSSHSKNDIISRNSRINLKHLVELGCDDKDDKIT